MEVNVEETLNNKLLLRVFRCFEEGRSLKHDESLSAYFRYDGALYVSDGVILYKDRVVVPLSLRPRVVNKLHPAHQDVTSMPKRLSSGLVLHRTLDQFKKSVKAATKTFLLNHRYHKSYLILLQVLSRKYLQIFSSLLETIF